MFEKVLSIETTAMLAWRRKRLIELAAPPSLSLLCFRLKDRSEAEHKLFLNELKKTGDCFIIHTKLGEKYATNGLWCGANYRALLIVGI